MRSVRRVARCSFLSPGPGALCALLLNADGRRAGTPSLRGAPGHRAPRPGCARVLCQNRPSPPPRFPKTSLHDPYASLPASRAPRRAVDPAAHLRSTGGRTRGRTRQPRGGERGGEGVLDHAPPGHRQALEQAGARARSAAAASSSRASASSPTRTSSPYASQVQVQANQAGRQDARPPWRPSRPGIDLAVLKLDDESFFATHRALPRAKALPQVKDAVLAYGFPTGGTSLSITKGIVSRIEFIVLQLPRPRGCASRSTPPSIPATAADRRSSTTR